MAVDIRMHYKKYKDNYSDHYAVDYDKSTKTICVIFEDDDPVLQSPNFGNRYRMNQFWFDCVNEETGGIFRQGCQAKSYDNALANMKKNGYKVVIK